VFYWVCVKIGYLFSGRKREIGYLRRIINATKRVGQIIGIMVICTKCKASVHYVFT
jgi:hypothetical protein